jgi:integrase/recombinase XerC
MNARAAALIRRMPSTGLYWPPLIAGKPAALRFLEFFTVNIRNKNTRAAYARAAGAFLRWCEGQGIGELGRVQPVHVAGALRPGAASFG